MTKVEVFQSITIDTANLGNEELLEMETAISGEVARRGGKAGIRQKIRDFEREIASYSDGEIPF